MDFGPTPTPTPTPCPTYSYISSGLTIYTDFSNPASYNGTGPTWYDLQGNFNGTISGQTTFTPDYDRPCAKYMQLQQNNEVSNITFPVASISGATTDFSFGGWVYTPIASEPNYIFTRGFTNTKITTDFYGRPIYSFEKTFPLGTVSKTGTTQLNFESFNYLYFTFKNGNELKGYLNGILQVTLGVSGGIASSIYGWGMGNIVYDTGDANSYISDFTEYNRCLSDAEVLTNYNYKKDLFPTYTPLTSGVTIEWVYNWTGSTNNVYLREYYQDFQGKKIPFIETDILLPAYGGSVSGSTVTYQRGITGTYYSNNITSVLNYCRTSSATLSTPRNWSWYKNDVLQYTSNGSGNITILGCAFDGTTETWSQTGYTVINIQDGDKLKYVVNNYLLPDSTPTPTPLPATNTPTPTISPTPTATNTPTPTPTPLPNIITSGLTIYVDGSFESYSGTGNRWFNRVTGTTITGATLSGSPTWNTSDNGFFTFDGVNDFGDFGSESRGTTTGSTTFGGWVKMTTGSTQEIIFQRGLGTLWNLFISKATDNKFTFSIVTSTFSQIDCPAASTLTSGIFYYVIAKWTAGSSLKIYINGAISNTVTNTQTTLRSNSTSGWYLSREDSTDFDVSNIGDFEVYDRALSDAEITSNFDAKKTLYGYFSPTATPTSSPTPLPATSTPTSTPTATPLPPTATPTNTPSPSPTPLPATATPTPSPTPTPVNITLQRRYIGFGNSGSTKTVETEIVTNGVTYTYSGLTYTTSIDNTESQSGTTASVNPSFSITRRICKTGSAQTLGSPSGNLIINGITVDSQSIIGSVTVTNCGTYVSQTLNFNYVGTISSGDTITCLFIDS
jgi:hypothetical protein